MARARNIKPGFFDNVQLGQLPMATRLCFIGLWTIADREGRLKDEPERIKVRTLPYDDVDVDGALNQLQDAGFIKRYEVKGCKYIQVINWDKHQNPHGKEQASIIPAPGKHRTSTRHAPGMHQANTVLAPDMHSTCPEVARLIPDSGFSDSLNSDSLNSDSLNLATLLATLIHEHNPNAKEPDLSKWAQEIDRMIRLDERDPQEIEDIIRWCQGDDFWYANILSAKKLREKYDQLTAHMSRDLKKSEPKGMEGLRYLMKKEEVKL
jgi:hypothetical protein